MSRLRELGRNALGQLGPSARRRRLALRPRAGGAPLRPIRLDGVGVVGERHPIVTAACRRVPAALRPVAPAR